MGRCALAGLHRYGVWLHHMLGGLEAMKSVLWLHHSSNMKKERKKEKNPSPEKLEVNEVA